MGYLNGMLSLTRYGLTNCDNGFGSEADDLRKSCYRIAVSFKDDPSWSSDGNLTWVPSDPGNASAVVAELDLLLAAGRLSDASRSVIEDAYDRALQQAKPLSSQLGDNSALQVAQQLFFASPEFATTNHNRPTGELRTSAAKNMSVAASEEDYAEPYRAIVFLMMTGGADTFNLLVPHSQCAAKDLYAEYAAVRDAAALAQDDLLTITADNATQPCSVFGLHPDLSTLRDLYTDGDAAFVANIGPLVEPLTKDEYESGTKTPPVSLFAHNMQQTATQSVHAQDASATGVLGRVVGTLAARGISTASYSVSGNAKILEGELDTEAPSQIGLHRTRGIVPFDEYGTVSELLPAIGNLTAAVSDSLFAETWASSLHETLARSATLRIAQDASELTQDFAAADGDNQLADQLEQVAVLMKARELLGAKRDVFYVTIGGFDTHSDVGETFAENMGWIDAALGSFAAEMKNQGLWENVTIVSASDFGRTLTSNGLGTDHAWAGNHFVAGGAVNGGQILGEYPNDLTDDGELNIGRGRLIPTTSWEAIWQPVASWFGIEDDEMSFVLPNLENFPESQRIGTTTLFE